MVHKVHGMPVKAVKEMLKNPRTPAHLKAFWKKVMGKSGRSGR